MGDVTISTSALEPLQELALGHSADALYDRIMEGEVTSLGNPTSELWPAATEKKPKKPTLRLVTLDRLGAEAGKSGQKVLVGYFKDDSSRAYGSKPFVIKITPDPEDDRNDERKEDLRDEARRVRKFSQFLPREYFALPIEHYDPPSGPAVLWAPFTSSQYPWNPKKMAKGLHLKVQDLWRYLTPGNPEFTASNREEALKAIPKVLDYMVQPHSRFGQPLAPREVNVVNHYDWELRNFQKKRGWAKAWHAMWAHGKEAKLPDGRTNPLFVLHRLKEMPKLKIPVGIVHGDLHPKNIVLDEHLAPHIIDFGWLRDREHLAKDFVLLECNARFLTLPPCTDRSALIKMAEWVDSEEEAPSTGNAECDLRCKLITELRNGARRSLATEEWDIPLNTEEWDMQYNISLFLVALGLLKHLHQATCQAAAMETVYSLSSRVLDYL